jgi:hypothetical protein
MTKRDMKDRVAELILVLLWDVLSDGEKMRLFAWVYR